MFIKPDFNVEKLEDIDFDLLKNQGKKLLFFDLDSTLMPSKSGEYLPKTKELIKKLKQDFAVVILSNNTKQDYIDKVRSISEIEVISHAAKTDTKVMLEYLNKNNFKIEEAVMIGDRPLTDILCGKRACITTILVDSITKDTEHKIVRFVRWLERLTIKK